MKVTKENAKDIKYIQGYHDVSYGISILLSLLIDLDELNGILEKRGESNRKLFIEYDNEHTKYSSERTDPCPDHYGLFTLRFESNQYETVGEIMTLNELDIVMCALVNFIEYKNI